jgi:hypothetical protein
VKPTFQRPFPAVVYQSGQSDGLLEVANMEGRLRFENQDLASGDGKPLAPKTRCTCTVLCG